MTSPSEFERCTGYLDGAKLLMNSNRSPEYPYCFSDLSILSGPQMLLCGHALELVLKHKLYDAGIDQDRLLKFRGFKYSKGRRAPKQAPRRHSLNFLFRCVSRFALTSGKKYEIGEMLSQHQYYREDKEHHLQTTSRPHFSDFATHVELLSSIFDAPYIVRYPQNGMWTVPDPEILIVGTEAILKTLATWGIAENTPTMDELNKK